MAGKVTIFFLHILLSIINLLLEKALRQNPVNTSIWEDSDPIIISYRMMFSYF